MKFYLKTLTPLHIGNGTELYALDYAIDFNKKVYYRITQEQFLKFLDNDEKRLSTYSNWIIETTEKIEKLERNRKEYKDSPQKFDITKQLSLIRKDFNLISFVDKKLGLRVKFMNFLESNKDILKISFDEPPKAQIRGHIKSPMNRPYIPGSSIKGSIRTAVLANYLNNHFDPNELEKLLREKLKKIKEAGSNFRMLDKIKSSFADEIERACFYCVKDWKSKKSNDELFDLFKLISVTDGILDTTALSLANINLYLLKKQRGGGIVSDIQKQTSSVESISPGILIPFELNLNIDFIYSLKDKISDEGIRTNNNVQWHFIKNKVRNVFNLDIEDINSNNKEEIAKEVIDYILRCVHDFSHAQVSEEKSKWLVSFYKNDHENRFTSKMKKGRLLFENEDRLMHFGFGSGFPGITEILFFLKVKNPSLKSLFEEVMSAFRIGDEPQAHKKRKPGEYYKANIENFPKSKRMVTTNDDILPLGWVKILGESEVSSMMLSENSEKFIVRPETPPILERYNPVPFNGKLKIGTELDAELISANGEIKVFNLFLVNGNQKADLRYYDNLPIGTIVKVKITNIHKDIIKNISMLRTIQKP